MINEKTLSEIKEHAKAVEPNEACGFVVLVGRKEVFIPAKNNAAVPTEFFEISASDYAMAEERGDIVRIIHSHTGDGATSRMSDLDRALCDESGIVWGIYSTDSGEYSEYEPAISPLVGRSFVLGANDCYGLAKAWHKTQGVELPLDLRVPYPWWDCGENLFSDENIERCGFVKSDLCPGCLIIMTVAADRRNHCGIYLDDDMLLHHMYGSLSNRIQYSGSYFDKVTDVIIRHKNLPEKLNYDWL